MAQLSWVCVLPSYPFGGRAVFFCDDKYDSYSRKPLLHKDLGKQGAASFVPIKLCKLSLCRKYLLYKGLCKVLSCICR